MRRRAVNLEDEIAATVVTAVDTPACKHIAKMEAEEIFFTTSATIVELELELTAQKVERWIYRN